MLLAHGGIFSSGRPRHDAARAVEARMVDDGRVVDHGPVDVDVSHDLRIYVHHRGVIGKYSASPFAAHEAHAAVAEAVINAAIEPNVRTPVACVPAVNTAGKTPVARGPEQAGPRRSYPYAGNPVVAHRTIGPISWRPKISFRGAGRLLINRQGRRS